MSGLAAVYRRDGAVTDERFEPLLDSLDYRGHDGRDRWHGDGVALGHQHFWTTPQAVGERQPVAVDGTVVALAGRLDDRDALAPALPAGVDRTTASDATLIGHAYREWGVDCLDRTVGAFGLLLWDRHRNLLVVARDKTGIRHLFFAVTDEAFVVGSDAATVRRHPAVADGPDESSLAAFLEQTPTVGDAGFYEGVSRVPPGTHLVADADGVRTERYWHPADAPDLGGRSSAELQRRLRDAVRQALQARLRCRDDPASLLSGGLDSSALAGVAAADLDRRLSPFSMVFEAVDDERLTRDERVRIHDVATAHDLPLTEVPADDAHALSTPAALDEALSESPCLDPLLGANDRLYRRVGGADHRVALTGHGGNVLNGTRLAYADLLRRGRLVKLLRAARRDPMPTRWVLTWYGIAPVVPSLAARLSDADAGPPEWIGPELRDREPTSPSAPGRFRSVHRTRAYERMVAIQRAHKLHVGHRRALRQAVTLRMPYLDARVVSVAFGARPMDLLANGQQNGLFGATFEDVYPPSVRSIRKGRHFDAFVRRGLHAHVDYLQRQLESPRIESRGYVRDGAARDQLAAFLDGEAPWTVPWRLFACERWLQVTDPPDRHAPT
ncbi:hypothetical protein BRC81_00725 [Halobacteriales archaeon QS_1_68_20]|nr:MAG: hypothetical protein BRC81_00725 [Halobacteriales archaeon QS_1_68_20]